MSKTVKHIIWVALALVLIGVLLMGVSFGLGARARDLWQGLQGVSWPFSGIGSLTYGNTRDWNNAFSADGQYSVAADGINGMTIDWISGEVLLTPYDGQDIRFVETSHENIPVERALRWGVDGSTLCIQYCAPGRYGVFPGKSIEVLVPTQLADAMAQLTIDATSADVRVSGMSIGDVTLEGISGGIDYNGGFERLYAETTSGGIVIASDGAAQSAEVSSISGRVEVIGTIAGVRGDTTSGDVRLNGDFDELNISTISGSIETTGTFMRAKADSTSASISLESVRQPEDIHVETISGSVTLRLPEDAGISLFFDSVSGKLQSSLPMSQVLSSGAYVYGDGTASARVSTTSGGLRIGIAGE